MKLLRRSLIILSVILVSSCGLTELDLLDNPNAVGPDNAEISLFFNRIQLDFKDFAHQANVLASPIIRQRAMTGGNTYNNQYAPTSFNAIWNNAYADLLPDLGQLVSIAEENEIPFYAAAGKTFEAYVLMVLVDFFGDIPYSEAGQGVSNPSPAADNQASVYDAALNLLNEAIAEFKGTSQDAIGSAIEGNDLFYGGDLSDWTAAASSLKLRYYITTRLVNSGAASEINALIPDVITSSGSDFKFEYGSNRSEPDSRHPWYANHYENGAGNYLSNYFMWSLDEEKGIKDPRLRYYFYRQDVKPELADAFTLDCLTFPRPLHYTGPYPWCIAGNGYWGRDHGNNDGIPPDGDRRSVYGVYPAGGKFDDRTTDVADADAKRSTQNSGVDGALGAGIVPIMMSSFVNFMLAESALVLGTNGDARTYLENGMRESIATVMSFGARDGGADASFFPSSDDVEAYVALVLSNYDAADNNGKLDIIMKEYQIASYGNGIEAYNGYRRTGFPSGFQPTREPVSGDFPRLMYYPADYVNLNAKASQRELTEQVFWDTNPAGFIF